MTTPPRFDAAFREKLAELFAWRRDVRHFRSDPLPEGCLDRLINFACLAPSVGLSQPWRFVVVKDKARRAKVKANFEAANRSAGATYGEDEARAYAALKLAGLDDAPEQLAVFSEPNPELGRRLGRRTMPETVH